MNARECTSDALNPNRFTCLHIFAKKHAVFSFPLLEFHFANAAALAFEDQLRSQGDRRSHHISAATAEVNPEDG
jgi:hypothetical protein